MQRQNAEPSRGQDGRPRVSVIMPAFNSAPYIEEAIRSVQAQTVGDWELVVADDGSTDETAEIVRRMNDNDNRVKLLCLGGRQGPARARNAAIEAAKGRFIAFLDSDDVWKPEKLERQIAFMREQDVAFSFTAYDRIDEQGESHGTVQAPRPVTYRQLLSYCVIGCLTAVYDTEKLGKQFMPDIPKRQDYALWLQILKQLDRAWPIDESLAVYRVRRGSVSSNKLLAARHNWRLYRDIEKLGFVRSAYYFCQYAVRGVWRTYFAGRARRV
jgi:teichuronic acid biosynthesis glycosyltransferase TuaG